MHNLLLKLFATLFLRHYLVFCDTSLPCSFHDTVDLSNSKKELNGSYFYDGIEIPQHLVAVYDHTYENFRKKIYTKSHLRGCLCKLTTCVKWCCAAHQIYLFEEQKCLNRTENETEVVTMTMNLLLSDNETVIKNVATQFYGLSSKLPCKFNYALRSNKYEEDEWYLFENASLLLPFLNQSKSKDEYCLGIDKDEEQYNIVPFICSISEIETISSRDIIYAFSLLVSVPCMLITMLVYLWVPELRSLHGKALACYLFGLSVGYSIISYILLKGSTEISPETCSVIGFLCYYCFMAAFFWLTVISFDLWWNFSGRKNRSRFTEQQYFLAYAIYSFGLAGCCLVIAIFIQNSKNIPDIYKPAIGGTQFCFLDIVTNWSAAIYFYGPIFIVIVFNILMFVLTSYQIHHVQCEMSKLMKKSDNERSIKSDKNSILKYKFGLYLRLFVIMGVTWTFEIITYVIKKDPKYYFMVYICDACNTLQGLLILILFVVKKQVKLLILEK